LWAKNVGYGGIDRVGVGRVINKPIPEAAPAGPESSWTYNYPKSDRGVHTFRGGK